MAIPWQLLQAQERSETDMALGPAPTELKLIRKHGHDTWLSGPSIILI